MDDVVVTSAAPEPVTSEEPKFTSEQLEAIIKAQAAYPTPAPEPEPEPSEEPVSTPEPTPAPTPAPQVVVVVQQPGQTVEDAVSGAGSQDQDSFAAAAPSPAPEVMAEESAMPPAVPPGDVVEPVVELTVQTLMELLTGDNVNVDEVPKQLQTLTGLIDHPVMTTKFVDYTVTEGLLLLVLIIVGVIIPCIKILGRGFKWLRL